MSDKQTLPHDPAGSEFTHGSRKYMLEAAFEHVLTPLAILDGKFNFIRVNEAFARLGNRPVPEYAGRNFFEFFPSAENVIIFMSVLNTREPYRAWSKPAAHLGMKSETSYFDWSITPVSDESGEVACLVLSLSDVTEREQNRIDCQNAYTELDYRVRQRTRELQESEASLLKYRETLELALAATGQGIWDWDIRANALNLSRRCKELFGLDPGKDVPFETSMEAILPEDRDRVRDAVLTALQNKTAYDVEMRVKLPDGSIHWLRSAGKSYYDERGEALRVSGTTWDITESRRMQEKLRGSEERLRIATAAADEAVWDWDLESGRIVFNDVYAERFGRPADESGIEWWLGNLHDEDRERVRESFRKAIKGTAGRWSSDYRFRMRNGSYAFVRDRANLIRDGSGRVRRVIGAMLDLTERKRIEEELERRTKQLSATNKELESFSYIVSHDLRSPIRALEGYTKMILKDYGNTFDGELKKRFDIILESTGKMNDIIEAMLALARAGNVELRISECDMKKSFQEAWESLKRENPDRKMKFNLKDMPNLRVDCRLMKQVVFNLLANAVKFTRKREEAVIEAGGRTGEKFTFYVKDNGAGFDMKYYDRLFNIFERLHSPKDYPGIGVGLPIVQRIMLRHGGKIWAEGEVDKGATFYFSLPKQAFRLS